MEYVSGESENLKRFAFGNVVGNIAIFVRLVSIYHIQK
jgi:hypothetical protein